MYMVYWTSVIVGGHLACDFKNFDGKTGMTDAMNFMEVKRKAGARFVTFCAEDPNCITQPGVDSVVNGKTPDGQVYDWTKKHRGEGPKPDDGTGAGRTLM
jgi:hypothetical protein